MKKKTGRRLSNALIAAGAALVIIGGGYELLNYPWHYLFAKLGVASVEESLPDPKPLPGGQRVAYDESLLVSGIADDPDLITVGQPVMSRPKVGLMQLGVIKIPKIGVSENVVEGTKEEMLYGVGHVRGSAMMGQEGNCVLSGHRDYIMMHPFRHLDKVEAGDKIVVEDAQNSYTYEVFKTFIANGDDRWVMGTQPENPYMLTLITCTPVLVPTHRMILWCNLTDVSPLEKTPSWARPQADQTPSDAGGTE